MEVTDYSDDVQASVVDVQAGQAGQQEDCQLSLAPLQIQTGGDEAASNSLISPFKDAILISPQVLTKYKWL